jgi:hypothetical protein
MREPRRKVGRKRGRRTFVLEEEMRPLVVTALLLALVVLAVVGAFAALVRGQRPALLGRSLGATV